MRKYLLLFVLAFMALGNYGCSKKAVEQQYDDILTKLMADGSWRVTKFMEGTTDNTAEFSGWVFTFYQNKTSTAVKGTTTQTGGWQSDITNQQFIVQPNPSSVYPLQKLEGTWKIVNATATVGSFSQTKSGVNYTLEMTKN